MTLRPLFVSLPTVLSLALSAAAVAQTPAPDTKPPADPKKPVQQVEKVEIQASQDAYDARREDTATKIVVTQEEIMKFGDTQLADVLKRQPGVTVQGSDIRMRGLGNGYTQILLNGERAPPGFSLDTLSPTMVERIEIVRAATAEFSTQSIAGTINIVLKKKVSVAQRELRVGVASGRGYKAPNGSFTLSDKDGNFSYALNGFVFHSDVDFTGSGEEEGNNAAGVRNIYRAGSNHFTGKFDGGGFSPRLNWTLANGDTITSQTFINYNVGSNDNERRYSQLIGVPPPYVTSLTHTKNENTLIRSDLNWVMKLAEGAKLDLKFGLTGGERKTTFTQQGYDVANNHNLDSTVLSTAKDNGFTLAGRYSTPYVEGHALVGGWDGGVSNRSENRDQHDRALPGVPAINSYEDFKASVSRLALFAQDEWNVTKDWSVYLGLRWEGVDTNTDGNAFSSVKNRSSVWSPLFQTLYKLPDRKGEQVRLALTRTYKAPPTASLTPRRFTSTNNSPTEPDTQGNPNLKPELATGIDAAYEKFWAQGASLSIAGSVRRITDFNRRGLQFINGRWVSLPINDGTAVTRSLDFDTKFPLQTLYKDAPPIDFRFNMNRNWSTVKSVPGPFNRLDQQTPFSSTIGLDYRMKGGEVVAGSSYSFKSGGPVRIAVDQSTYVSPKREVDFYGLWKFTKKDQIRLTLANVLRQDQLNESTYFDNNGSLRRATVGPSSMHVRLNLEMKF